MGRLALEKGARSVSVVASVDVGTNCAMLLIAEVSASGQMLPIFEQEKIIGLGEKVDRNRKLKPEAIERAVQALTEYRRIAAAHKATEFFVTGTSAVRDAENRDVLVAHLSAALGVKLELLSGLQEAHRTYFGALSNKTAHDGSLLVWDIGGGSTEFLVGNNAKIVAAKSLNIGSVRLTERYIANDPVTADELGRLSQYVASQILPLAEQWRIYNLLPARQAIGIAGTVTTIAAVTQRQEVYDPEAIDGSTLGFDDVERFRRTCVHLPMAEIAILPGVVAERASFLLAGAVILSEIMRMFELAEIVVSHRGLRYGTILARYLKSLPALSDELSL